MSASGPANKSELSPGEVASLASILDYQPGAVISRVLLKRPSASITLFAFDQDQGLSEHTSTSDALVQILEGTAVVTLDNKVFGLDAGQSILLPANQPHSVHAQTPFKMLLTMMRP